MASKPNVQQQRKSFGQRLRQVRKSLSLTAQQLSAKLGVQRTVVAQYETGRTFPSVAVLLELAEILHVSLDWLLCEQSELRDQIQDKELLAYFAKADRLDPRERAVIKIILENMLARQELDQLKLAARKEPRAA